MGSMEGRIGRGVRCPGLPGLVYTAAVTHLPRPHGICRLSAVARLCAGVLALALALAAQLAHLPVAHASGDQSPSDPVMGAALEQPAGECAAEPTSEPDCAGPTCGACVAFPAGTPAADVRLPADYCSAPFGTPRRALARPFRPPILPV